MKAFVAAALTAMAPFAQQPDRLRFVHIASEPAMSETATIFRAVAEVSDVAFDGSARELVFQATGNSRTLAVWIHGELDRPAAAQRGRIAEFLNPEAGSDWATRIFFTGRAGDPQSLHELATAIRGTIGIRRVFASAAFGAIIVRGTEKQTEAAQWLLGELGADPPAGSPRQFDLNEREGIVRVVKVKRHTAPAELQELATLIRAAMMLRYIFTVNAIHAIVVRGTPESLDGAQWFASRIEEAPGSAARQSFTLAKDDDNRMFPALELRAYLLPASYELAQIQQLAVKLRAGAQLRLIFTHNTARLIAARGTGDQIAAADRLFDASVVTPAP
ncbi:MAG: hypothetical protein R2729_18650 [Bryobacteraceae bacterium]